MSEPKIQNPKSKIFLGVDGGQSHTEAVVADERGNVLGRGFGGASNHAEYPGGRERLRNAIFGSAGDALKNAGLPTLEDISFESAHFGMTGGADYKEEIIGEIVTAEHFAVGHDAPTALFGATSGKPGIVVIAGTGSVVYGENESGETTKIGGLGYLFSDEGSGFWLALQVIRLAIKEQDGLIANSGLESLVLDFFKRKKIRELTNDYYNAKMTRDDLASFAKRAHEAALAGNIVIQEQIKFGANILAKSVVSAAHRLSFEGEFPVAGVGGMFRAALLKKYFSESLREELSEAVFTEPRFNPAIGALLLAFRQAGIEINEDLLKNLEKDSKKNEQNG
ncbi:MAG TPA: BadF/BadG/BcrA/BcrD ATPase family protein [Pyrinomonadaceae bacterium]